jgi:aspartokinase/homoserine dehydrogenase 1
VDVARKILILVRETGVKLELNDISVESLIPDELNPELSVDEFINQLADFDKLILKRFEKARSKQKVLRYIGSWDGQKAKVGLEEVTTDSPFYNQKGRENLIVLRSNRYNDVPLVIKGHGAGASVTAAGVFYDIQSCLEDG